MTPQSTDDIGNSGPSLGIAMLFVALSKILRVRRERLLDALSSLGSRSAERDNARQIGHVRAPAPVFGLLVDHEILVHRRCSNPLAVSCYPASQPVPCRSPREFR